MNKNLIAGIIVAFFISSAQAFEPFVVKDIRVEGIQRTEAGTVFSYLPVKVGDTMTDDKAALAIKTLFATGFFKDVRLEIEGNLLVVFVEERPAIASLDFVGIKEFNKDDFKKTLSEVGLKESRIFDRALLEQAEQEFKRHYISKGYYAVNVTTTVTPLERNRVGINFNVDEGAVAKIKQINIIGAQAFKEKDLLDLFALRTPGLMTWYTKNDQYSREKLSGDLEALRSYYQDLGYLEFNLESTQVSITPDKKDIYITINIFEGEKYTVSSIKLAGNLLLPEEELKKLVLLKPGDIFSREKLTESTKKIGARLGNEGYAFANVNAAPELDKEKRKVDFTIFIDPGRRVYIRQVNVTGNTVTRDEVIRREMRQIEAAWYDGEKINKSRRRVDNLGYFDEVAVETPAVPGATDQVDVNIKVKEKPTGNMMLGGGFSSSDKFMFSGSVSKQNLFGSGKHISVGFNTSKYNQVYSLSYTDPYATMDGVSQGFDIYKRDSDTSSASIGSYVTSSYGGGVRYGVPISDEDGIGFGLSYDSTKINLTDYSPPEYVGYVLNGHSLTKALMATIGWGRNTLDSTIYPTKGVVVSASGELTLPPGDLRYYRANFQYQRYFPVTRTDAVRLNAELGFGHGYGGQVLPFTKYYFAGGVGSVHGYGGSSLGPANALGARLGGDRRLVGNAEYLFPMPGMGKDKSVRMGAFMDAGQVWGVGEKLSLGNLRYSAGLSLSWASPMGPLKFIIANPIGRKPGDVVQRIQFIMGTQAF